VAEAEAEMGEFDAALTRLNKAFAEDEQTGERCPQAATDEVLASDTGNLKYIWLGFSQPKSIESHDVVDAEIVIRVVTLNVVVPDVVDLLPSYGQ
jgi:hypothetical protein